MKMITFHMAEHGRSPVLATRELGRQVGRQVQDELAGAEILLLTFTGVEVASPPFLDEIVRAVHSVLRGGDTKLMVVTLDMNEDVRESLALVLDRHKLMLAALSGGQIELLGGSRQLAETLREAQRLREFTAPELAERLRLKLPNLHQRLKALTEAGALVREEDETAERGRRHRYRAPDADELADVEADTITPAA